MAEVKAYQIKYKDLWQKNKGPIDISLHEANKLWKQGGAFAGQQIIEFEKKVFETAHETLLRLQKRYMRIAAKGRPNERELLEAINRIKIKRTMKGNKGEDSWEASPKDRKLLASLMHGQIDGKNNYPPVKTITQRDYERALGGATQDKKIQFGVEDAPAVPQSRYAGDKAGPTQPIERNYVGVKSD